MSHSPKAQRHYTTAYHLTQKIKKKVYEPAWHDTPMGLVRYNAFTENLMWRDQECDITFEAPWTHMYGPYAAIQSGDPPDASNWVFV